MFAPSVPAYFPRLQATRLLTLFAFGTLLLLASIAYSSLLAPHSWASDSSDAPDSPYPYYASPYEAARSAASRFFKAPRVTLFSWAGGNHDYALEPLADYADLGAYPVGAKPWNPDEGTDVLPEWTLPHEHEHEAAAQHGTEKAAGENWDFPAPQRDDPVRVLAEHTPPTVEFALVIIGETAAMEAVTMLKGVLMHISTPVHFHIVCDEDAMYYIDERITIVSRPSYDINMSYNIVTDEQIWARARRAGIGSTYHAGAGGIAKVFLHEILTETARAIFIDIDTLFTVDPLLLWKEFNNFRPGQVFALPTLGPDSDELTVCSCALLLDLGAMRTSYQWVASDLRPRASQTDVAYAALMGAGLDPLNPPFGDQGVYYAIWRSRPELAGHLSLSWDVSHCRNHWGLALDDGGDEMRAEEQEARRDARMRDVEPRWRNAPERQAIFPGILHFNCIDNHAIAFSYSDIVDAPAWGPIVQTATQYKWTWLNRGDGSARVERVMYEDVRFADERWPEVELGGGWTPPAAVAVELPVVMGTGEEGMADEPPMGMPVPEFGDADREAWEFGPADEGGDGDSGVAGDHQAEQEQQQQQEQEQEQEQGEEVLPAESGADDQTTGESEWLLGEDGELYHLDLGAGAVQEEEQEKGPDVPAAGTEEWESADNNEPESGSQVDVVEEVEAYAEQPAPLEGDWMDEPGLSDAALPELEGASSVEEAAEDGDEDLPLGDDAELDSQSQPQPQPPAEASPGGAGTWVWIPAAAPASHEPVSESASASALDAVDEHEEDGVQDDDAQDGSGPWEEETSPSEDVDVDVDVDVMEAEPLEVEEPAPTEDWAPPTELPSEEAYSDPEPESTQYKEEEEVQPEPEQAAPAEQLGEWVEGEGGEWSWVLLGE